MKEELEILAHEDGRFSPQVVHFVYEALGHITGKGRRKQGNVTGGQFCEGLRDMAIERWGMLSPLVLGSGGVNCTGDFGQIVYLLIRHKWMKAQPSDSIDDFNDVYDFKKAFGADEVFERLRSEL